MKVMILRSVDVPPDPKPLKVKRVLKKAGYDVKIISWKRMFKDLRDPDSIYFELKSGYGKGLRNLFGMLTWNLFVFFKLLASNYDVVHAFDLDTGMSALLASKIKRKKIVYEILDLYSQSRRIPKILKRLADILERFVANRSDVLVIPDERRIDQIRNIGIKRYPEVLYNTVEDIYPVECQRNGTRILSYVGILQPDRGVLEIARIIADIPNWRMVIAGFGPLEEKVRKLANEHDNLMFLGRVSHEKALEIEGCSDAILAVYKPSVENNRFSSPNKFFEALMLGVPLIVIKGSGIDEIVEKYGIGVVIGSMEPKEIQKALERIEKDGMNMAVKARKLYREKFSWSGFEETLLRIYRSLGGDIR